MTAALARSSAVAPKKGGVSATPALRLQRRCACGGKLPGLSGDCEECRRGKLTGVQAKLHVGAAHDRFESEADHVADAVLRDGAPPSGAMTIHSVQGEAGLSEAPAAVGSVLASPGRTLDTGTLSFFENRFGHDFSRVRIHDDAAAAESARSVHAQAYAAGNHIAFAPGHFAPATHAGRHLLAHELTHVVQQGGSNIAVQRREDPESASDDKTPESKGEPAAAKGMQFEDLVAQDHETASAVERLSTGYRALLRRVEARLTAAKVYDQRSVDNALQRAARLRVFETEDRIQRDNLYDAEHLSQWLEIVSNALAMLAPLLAAWQEARPRDGALATQAEATRASLAQNARQLASSRFMRAGVADRERRAAVTREQERIRSAVSYARSFVQRDWRPDMSDAEGRMYGTVLANQLVYTLKLDSAQVREVLDTLKAEDPDLLQAALFRGGTVDALMDEYHHISGLQAYRAEGEGFFAGAIRADRESRAANRPGQRTFSLRERLIAAAGFIAGAFQGIGDSIISNLKGIVELFTPAFWHGMLDFFRNFLPKFIESEDVRFQLGQMMGQFSADEERRLAVADPAEYGRTFGQVFGMALTEIVLSFVGLGFVLKAFNGSARLQKIARPLVEIARALASTAVAARAIRFAEVVGEAINALSLRIRKLSMLLPDLTPNARLRRTLFEMEEGERELQKAFQRANELEKLAREALALGDNERAQQHLEALAKAADEVERLAGRPAPPPRMKAGDVAGEAGAARRAVDEAKPVKADPKVSDKAGAPPATAPVDARQLKEVGWVSDETIEQFRKHPEQLHAWADNPGAAKLLKHCHSPCFPNMTPPQVKEFEEIVRQLGRREISLDDLGVDAAELTERLKKADEAGINRIIADIQKQLDAEPGGGHVLDDIEEAARKRQHALADNVDEPHPSVPEERPEGDLFNKPQSEIDADVLRRERGNTFNTEMEPRYEHNEVRVDAPVEVPVAKPPAATGKVTKAKPKPQKPKKPQRFIVDSFDENLGSVSRKFPEGQQLDAERGFKYIEELINKYPPGTVISNTPQNIASGLAGRTITGRPTLLLPELHGDVPEEVLAFAERVGVTIMDAEGRIYLPLLPH